MPKYLIEASYTTDGLQGLLKEGGSSRRETVEKMIANLGGSTEAFYYAFGDTDVYVICDLPDASTAAALALTISATGKVQLKTTVLITPEEVDKASKISVDYRPPGG